MAKFAPVVPVNLAHEMRCRELLGNYHLLLAHDVVKYPSAYEDVYNDDSEECDNNFIIMDNSVIELGSSVSGDMLQEACEIVDANILALPDVPFSALNTCVKTTSAFDNWGTTINFNKIKPMIIPQGRTFSEWKTCAKAITRHNVSKNCCVGIPRNVREKLGTPRGIAVTFIHDLLPDAEIHLLGFSNDLMDDIITAKLPYVSGIDSTVPVRQTALMRMDQEDPGLRGDWWDYMIRAGVERLTNNDWHVIEHNLDFIRTRIK